jgi:hypothetical protein
MWNDDIKCKLGCADENDTIEHVYNCAKIEVKRKCASSATYLDLFKDMKCQQKALSEFTRLKSKIDDLLDQEAGGEGLEGRGPGRQCREELNVLLSLHDLLALAQI